MSRGVTETSLSIESLDGVLAKMSFDAIVDQVHFCEDIHVLNALINKCNEIVQHHGFGFWRHGHLSHHDLSALIGKAEGRHSWILVSRTASVRANDPKRNAEIYYKQEVGYNGAQESKVEKRASTGRRKRGTRSID